MKQQATKGVCVSANRFVDIPALEAAIAEFDCTDLLSAVAGLQLLPENAERVLRLEALAYIVASGQSRRSRRVAPHTLAALCNCEALQTIAHGEDPFDNVFCEEVAFHGGSYKVLPGITEHATFIVKRIMEAIFLHRDPFPDMSFVSSAIQMIHGTLALSDKICAAGGITRNPELDSTFNESIVVPNRTRLAQLKASVHLNHVALREFLRSKGLSPNCLAPLTVKIVELPHEDHLQVSGLLVRRPIVAGATDIVVASPTELLPALRNALVALAQDRGVIKELASRFGSATWQAVHEHLRYINCEALRLPTPSWADAPIVVHDGYFSLDTDKVIYCLFVSDSLEDYDRSDPFGHWRTPDMTTKIRDRLRTVVQDVHSKLPQINEILAVVLTQSIGRSIAFGISDSDITALAISAADLCTLCLLEGGKDLILWQFAKSQETISKQAQITQTGILDEYAIYRKNGYTYYATDDFRPTLIAMVPGMAGLLRREVYRERDWHGIPSFRRNELIEVTCFFGPSVPIYVPSEHLGTTLALVVEDLPLPVWVTAPDRQISKVQRRVYGEFIEALAYWIWQFAPVVRSALQYLSRSRAFLRVIVELDWMDISDEPVETAEPVQADAQLVTTEVLSEDSSIIVRFQQGIQARLSGSNNAGERLFVRALLLAIRGLAPVHLSRALRDLSLEQTMDRFAPLGLKKKIFYLSLERMPQLDRRGLPDPRHVQEVDKNALLDHIGEHFRRDQHFEIGPIESVRVPKVINDIVKFCYEEFATIVSSLSPEGLLEWLVAHHESNVRAAANASLTMATRVACFGESAEFLKEASKGLSEASEAAVAGRFLIEYVSAQLPSGFRPISLSVFDALLARAAIITTYGMVSDIVYFDIAKIEVDMLGSGRLGFRRDEYQAAMDEYRSRFAASQVANAAERFRRSWRRLPESDQNWRNEVEEATKAEFGFPLSKLMELLEFAVEMGLRNPPIIRMKYGDAVAAFSRRGGWDEKRVQDALEMFLSRPRKDFFLKGDGYTREDVYPWRYGRRISYLRRPFIVEESDGTWLIWGHRHMKDAQRYLLQTCFGGRMQARSNEMKALVSHHANREGEVLNDAVANRLEKISGMVVKRRVKKIGSGSHAIQPPGDIDVLVFGTTNRTIYVLECKNLAFARTPFELASELRALTESKAQHKSIIEKHQRRVLWVKENLPAVLTWAGFEAAERWHVQSAVVVDEPLMSPKLRNLGEPVFSLSDLAQDAPDESLDSLCAAVFTSYRVTTNPNT